LASVFEHPSRTGGAQNCPTFFFIKSSFAHRARFDHDSLMAERKLPLPSRKRPANLPRRKRAANLPRWKRPAIALDTRELPIWPEPVQRGSLVDMLQRHVAGLRDEDAHGNRKLFLDDVFIAYLLAFFNPSIRTLRTLEDFSQTKQAQEHLSVSKICRSTLGDFQQIAEPERLQPIVESLRSELARKCNGGRLPNDLAALHKKILAVDGTFFPAAADVAWAVVSRNQRDGECHRARTDWQVNIATMLPELMVVPDPGESESDSAARHVVHGSISIYDRAYMSFHLISSFYERDPQSGQVTALADFVIRLKKTGPNAPTLEEMEVRELDAEARAAGMTSDRLVKLPGLKREEKLVVTLREVVFMGDDGKEVRLLTTLLTVPAHVIAILYKYRWQVELFFKWLKCYANFNHLASHCREGVLLSFYVTIIGVLLLYLHTSFRPSKYAIALLSSVAQGATLAEIMPILRERERQCEVARQSAARRRAKKKAATN
jgi:DDE family transposase